MKFYLNLLIVASSSLIFCECIELTFSAKSSTTSSPASTTPSNVTVNSTASTIHDNHGSTKKLILPSDQFDQNITTNQTDGITEPPVIIHYVDFNLTENFNTSNEFYVVRNNDTNELISSDISNETLIDQGKHMINQFYNKMAHLMDYDSMDSNVLYNLWIPFLSGFGAGLTLLLLLCCCRTCYRRCFCCRKSNKMSFNPKGKRGSKKIQSLDDNRYLLVSNHSDSEGV